VRRLDNISVVFENMGNVPPPQNSCGHTWSALWSVKADVTPRDAPLGRTHLWNLVTRDVVWTARILTGTPSFEARAQRTVRETHQAPFVYVCEEDLDDRIRGVFTLQEKAMARDDALCDDTLRSVLEAVGMPFVVRSIRRRWCGVLGAIRTTTPVRLVVSRVPLLAWEGARKRMPAEQVHV
jgi:hypothetical protein